MSDQASHGNSTLPMGNKSLLTCVFVSRHNLKCVFVLALDFKSPFKWSRIHFFGERHNIINWSIIDNTVLIYCMVLMFGTLSEEK